MKYIILLLSAGSIGYAFPQAAAGQTTLPFKPAPLRSGIDCPAKGGYSEDACGTKRFCKAIDIFGANSKKFKTKPTWASTDDCFKAHAPEPKQALLEFNYSSPGADCEFDFSEEACGTKEYCAQIDDIAAHSKLRGEDTEQSEDIRYESTEECLKAHVPEKPASSPSRTETTKGQCE
ncbi:hypothetical protein CCM_07962 [Cordyceps militaris CM01]|uniref:Uncharacterized protein n=1 Tax=Cordyceps militaris (strain CM01) TaxID=983644 RepID=G3JPA0_CORMM|nr:uncharacterized protein CCM_07962 [Cordyceps militaris CM01]EGX89710.1 hypothetical protein CCM_07962 [Cordyceps militaris CM01]